MSTSAVPSPPNSTPELLYLLHGDPADLADALSGMRAADIAEALRQLKPDAAAKVLAALPFDLAVQVFDEPELVHDRCAIIQHMDERSIGPLVDAMRVIESGLAAEDRVVVSGLLRAIPGQKVDPQAPTTSGAR